MRSLGLVGLLLLIGCGKDASPGDSGVVAEEDSGADEVIGVCDRTLEVSGAVVGERDCAEGRCTVAAGPFVMGSPDPYAPERCPEREVGLSAYEIGETEVTVADWEGCVDDGACAELPHCESEAEVDDPASTPAVCMSWQEASDYCAWTGGRLPTEAEWEKAARGLDAPTWPWGDTPPSCFTANFRFVSGYCEGGPVEVGRYGDPEPDTSTVSDTRSAFGLLDASGNVWEWTSDWYDAGWYRDAPDSDPGSPETCRLSVGEELGECRYRVIRGGAFNSTESTTETSVRSFVDPALHDVNIGLRCAWDPS